ncbi:type II toxin-antitoxin system YafQ family toxin [Rickettsia endosymbiont of Oedothorax gibbosus]|uniref:type II toxin-antitoxin system YafQ family toxin n=1 Tax=Rickettsia endosymbiont of Oedothorax gibbosus TaxID=931099 RepID=UPI00202456B3|nr:type II toxin-antitoxin system YafQ family toxin [Rickettsia endosymbiont of Oedothorax gibbosus]
MRTIKRTTQFKRDYTREKRRQHGVTLDNDLSKAIELLVIDAQLPKCMREHPLIGDWKDCRDCHIKSDLVLIYQKSDDYTLKLIRLGSHSELSL